MHMIKFNHNFSSNYDVVDLEVFVVSDMEIVGRDVGSLLEMWHDSIDVTC